MTVEIRLLPDGQGGIPQELISGKMTGMYLTDVQIPDNAPIDSWIDIEQKISGGGEELVLRVRGIMLSDVPDSLLNQCHEALTKQVAGVKPHPEGWVEYDEPGDNLPTNR